MPDPSSSEAFDSMCVASLKTPKSFKTIIKRISETCLQLRTNVKSREEFKVWKEEFCTLNKVCFLQKNLICPPETKCKLYHQLLRCHHGFPHKGVKKQSTGCRASMVVIIRKVNPRSEQGEVSLSSYPCFITLKGKHNHPTDETEFLNQLKTSDSTKEMFETYFEQGMTVPQAARYHAAKLALQDNIIGPADRSVNPSMRRVSYFYEKYMESKGGSLRDQPMIDCLRKYAIDHPDVTLLMDDEDGKLCVALITPFMRRVHKGTKEAGEIVFVSAVSCVDKMNCAVVPLMSAGSAGAVLLAMIFTTSQDEQTLTKGFNMIKEALGDTGFYGKGAPICFMTGTCVAERSALKTVWPTSQQFLSIIHLLQQVWRWLSNSKHGIEKADRQELIAVTKQLLYANSEESLKQTWTTFQDNPLSQKYESFTRYMNDLLDRQHEWLLAHRSGILLRKCSADNFCEASMYMIKNIALNWCKAHRYNMAQLVIFVAEIFDVYMKQKLVDVSVGQKQIKWSDLSKLNSKYIVDTQGNCKFSVKGENDSNTHYDVDLAIGFCSCPKGESCIPCEHQVACADNSMIILPQALIDIAKNGKWLANLALSKDKIHPQSIYFGVNDGKKRSATGMVEDQVAGIFIEMNSLNEPNSVAEHEIS